MVLHKIEVPSQVLNGSLPYVILDCEYSLNHSEMGGGMVLKWYRNGQNIYQWIPPANPRVRIYIYNYLASINYRAL